MRDCDVTTQHFFFLPMEKIYEQGVDSEAPTTDWVLINPVWIRFMPK